MKNTTESFEFQWSRLPEAPYLLSDPIWRANVAEYILEELESTRQELMNKRVLDAGLGNGRWAYGFQRLGCQVFGFDTSPSGVAYAKQHIQGGKFDVADILDIVRLRELYAERSMDIVWCTPGDTIIAGDYEQIQNMSVGSSCFGNGKVQKVNEKFQRVYDGLMYKVKGAGMLPILLTPDHPLLVSTGEVFHRKHGGLAKREFTMPYWKTSADLQVGHGHVKRRDYLIMPRMKGICRLVELRLEQFTNKHGLDVLRGHNLPDSITLSEEVMWLFGLYVAEGWSGEPRKKFSGRVTFSLHEEETRIHRRLVRAIKKMGYSPHIWHEKQSRGVRISFCSNVVARAFKNWFGSGASQKRIPDFILLHQNMRFVHSFLRGYEEGDGCIYEGTMKAKTVSKVLALQLQLLYARSSIFAHLYSYKLRPSVVRGRVIGTDHRVIYQIEYNVKRKQRGALAVILKDKILVQISKTVCQNYSGRVYNIGTTDNTYLISNALVHNCWGVLHHTTNPKQAFSNLANFVKIGGKLHIYVYGKKSLFVKLLHTGFSIFSLEHRLTLAKILSETLGGSPHSSFDAFSPDYSEHTEGEVKAWFVKNGLSYERVYPTWPWHGDENSSRDIFATGIRTIDGDVS